MDCSPPGASVHGISQARILEWVAISYSRGSSRSRNQTCVSSIFCTGRQILYHRTIWEGLGCLCSNCPGSSGFLRQECEWKYYIWDVPGSGEVRWEERKPVVKGFMSELLPWATRTQSYCPLPIRQWRPQFRIVPTFPPTTTVLLFLSSDFHTSNQKKPSERETQKQPRRSLRKDTEAAGTVLQTYTWARCLSPRGSPRCQRASGSAPWSPRISALLSLK